MSLRQKLASSELIEWTQVQLDPDTCEECGGNGEIIYGDGGYPDGQATETGYSEVCPTCGGSGQAGLQQVARDAVKLIEKP